VSLSLLSSQNSSGSTPLHWAVLNSHLSIAQMLVGFPGGPGVDLIDIKNSAGLSPLGEAENAGWDEGAKWLVEMMKLDSQSGDGLKEEVGDANEEDQITTGGDVDIEIQDADGQVARMRIGGT
jgi:uncharacterized protein